MSERSGTLADDPFGGRHPTSHERLTGLPWDASYDNGPAPWDTGQPQPAVVRLASEGGFAGAVLDAGCGTGENALHIAALGLPVLGVDVAETALAIAREKADDRGIEVEFAAADAFQLERLGRRFETVLDCGLFHTFDGDERPGYVASLASVTEHNGTLYVLCFSDDGPDTGPHPVGQEELRAAFGPGTGWNVTAIEPDRLHTRYHDDGAPAWLATIERIQTGGLVSPGGDRVMMGVGSDHHMSERTKDTAENQGRTPLRYNQAGLRGRLARVLVEEPTDEIDWPADLPAGIDTVVILDDAPNPHHTLRVHPPGDPTNIALVVFDQLALCEDQR